jgi:hypothetical protein
MTPPEYETSVFINCPFDSTYRPLFEAVAFSVLDCGFRPRCALEVDDSSQVRLHKINGIIADCRLAIHDISRTQLDEAHRLPRFNMPFELGIFVGAKTFGAPHHRRKACIILDDDRYRYQKFISDIAGQDIREHGRRAAAAIHQVRNFLADHRCLAGFLPGGRVLARRFADFRGDLPDSCRNVGLDRRSLTFRDLTTMIRSWIMLHPLPHHAPGAAMQAGARSS